MTSLNDNTGKRNYGLLLTDFNRVVDEIVDHIAYGAFERPRSNGEKGYGRLNWAESIGTEHAPQWMEDNIESIERHTMGLRRGEIYDVDGRPHAIAISVRSMMLRAYQFESEAGE